MNNQQRKYLIDKIKAQQKILSDAHFKAKPEKPDLMMHLTADVLANTFRLRPNGDIAASIRQRAFKSSRKTNFLNPRAWDSKDCIEMLVEDLFEMPVSYVEAMKDYEEKHQKWSEQSANLSIEVDTLETRIMLASDARLRAIIDEVDDMGNLSLIDSKLRGFEAPTAKLIENH